MLTCRINGLHVHPSVVNYACTYVSPYPYIYTYKDEYVHLICMVFNNCEGGMHVVSHEACLFSNSRGLLQRFLA